ncbi:RNA methyltransferase [Alphaproteobacteria bacterium]|nr:RNA methyltransferase [Alphaproteobacteria bacterium]
MRIISGKFRHQILFDTSKYSDLHPTTDRNRQALFNVLTNGSFLNEISFNLLDANVLDLCCGTGAIGFEAISRGAKTVTAIDNNHEHLTIAKKNAEKLKISNNCNFILADTKKLPVCNENFDLIFIDPPYSFSYQVIFEELKKKSYLKKNQLVVVESQIKNQSDMENYYKNRFEPLGQKIYGKTIFDFLTPKFGEFN